MELWYDKPASRWNEALPLGNGRLGAMVFGGMNIERIQLNEDSVWSGKQTDRNNPDCYGNLEEIRRLIFEEKTEEAEELASYAMTGTPQHSRPYQTLGNLNILFFDKNSRAVFDTVLASFMPGELSPDQKYRRGLRLEDGTAYTMYEKDGTEYEREYFASCPDDVIVIHFTAKGTDKLRFACSFERKGLSRAGHLSEDTIAFGGDTGEGAVKFTGALKALSRDGNIRAIGEHLIVEDASEVTLLFTAATSFRYTDPARTCEEILEKASAKSYEELKQTHIKDYQSLFQRVELRFDTAEHTLDSCMAGKSAADRSLSDQPTDVRLQNIKNGAVDPSMIAMYYQYGRYLMISGSRPGALPLNLQGVWCEDYEPSWNSSYTININTQMNYWLAESGNLSECHLPLFDLLERMKKNGQKTAETMYHCRGFVAHHVTDLYADTAPQDKWMASTYWPMGAAWLSTHIWEHYEYTKDAAFLEGHYDTLYQAVLFFKDFLVENEGGCLVTCPSLSPENTFITENGGRGRLTCGPAMDNQILSVLFQEYIKASEILGKDEAFRNQVKEMLGKLPVPQIGRNGQIVEWVKDYEEAEPGHRHISQLYGLYPGNLFTWEDTPELMAAAEATMNRRLANGGGHVGWSRAWIILLWARLRKKEKVMENLQALLAGSTFDNLMDSHPLYGSSAQIAGAVFQIDGNMGGAASITEMLVQSYGDHIVLLPALPDELGSGSIKGLKVRGGAELEMTWHDGRVEQVSIKAEKSLEKTVVVNQETRTIRLQPGEVFHYVRENK